MDVRSMVVAWPEDAPRGAVVRFVRQHGVSRSWFYDVRSRAQIEGTLAALQPRPRVPSQARHSQAIPAEVEELAIRIRKELADAGWDHGPVTVRHRLAELGITAPAASTLARVFARHGMVVPQPQKRPRTSYRRFAFAMVHECWQLDAFEWLLADGTPCRVFQVLDDCSRFLVASRVGPGERAEDAVAVIATAIDRFQVPCLLLSDNGAAFNQNRRGRRTQLVDFLQAQGCRPITGKPGHPQTQGKDERVHATLQRWLRARPAAHTLAELQALIDEFDQGYNHHRPHQALGMRTPGQALTDGPIAIPPTPPAPPRPATPKVSAGRRRVSANGKITVANAYIQLGTEHARTEVTVITSGNTINVFDTNGTHLRAVVLIPGQRYYGNGLPRWRRIPKCPQ